MQSPFPGMDPYLEACGLWEGFHDRLIARIDETLARQLPRGYTIDIASRTFAVGEERQLVTCIEVLSPSNKRPNTEGWDEYQRKRQAMLLGRANFIELDLLRGGQKPPMLDPWPDCPYTLLVCRRCSAPTCRVWKAHWQHRLPAIPVALAGTDPDMQLDLQPLLDGIYELGRSSERLDYKRPLMPPFKPTERAWLRARLRKRAP